LSVCPRFPRCDNEYRTGGRARGEFEPGSHGLRRTTADPSAAQRKERAAPLRMTRGVGYSAPGACGCLAEGAVVAAAGDMGLSTPFVPQLGMPSSMAVPSSWSFHVSTSRKGGGSLGKTRRQKLKVSRHVWPQRAAMWRFRPHEALLSSNLAQAPPTTILSGYLVLMVR